MYICVVTYFCMIISIKLQFILLFICVYIHIYYYLEEETACAHNL